MIFFVIHNVYIGISLDGLQDSHNITRPFINGEGSYDSVINNLKLVKEKQGRASVISVITKYNVNELVKIVEFAKELKIDDLAFNPVHSNDHTIVPKEQELTNNLLKVTDLYLSDLLNDINTPKLDHPKRYISMLLHNKKYSDCCLFCSAGPSNPLIAIDVDGYLYPCDHFWGEMEYAIGHIDSLISRS